MSRYRLRGSRFFIPQLCAVCLQVVACSQARTGEPEGQAPLQAEAPPAVVKNVDTPKREAKAEPVVAEDSEPAPEPEPELPKLPDGRDILPCEAAPEGMACIDGGKFIRGSDDGPDNTRPAADIWLQTYYMDLNEVTYSEYKACQKAKKCPKGGPLYNDFSHPQQPINGITWYAAKTYCEVHGKHLPTEAEWEKAARGPDGKLHPWGDEPATCERAVIKDHRGRSCGVKKKKEHPDKGKPFVVGSRPPGVYGLYDMSGNSWEWVADWYSKSYAACGEACLGVDPKGPCDGAETCKGHDEKLVRGGSWYWVARYATAIYRRPHFPQNDPFHHFSFRCAATADEAAALRSSHASEAQPSTPENAG